MITIKQAVYCISTIYPNDDGSHFDIYQCCVDWTNGKNKKLDVTQTLTDKIYELEHRLKACDSLVVDTFKEEE